VGKQSAFQAVLNFLSKEDVVQHINSLLIGLVQVMNTQQKPSKHSKSHWLLNFTFVGCFDAILSTEY